MSAPLTVAVSGLPIGQGRVTTYGRGMTVHSNAKTLKPWRALIAANTRQEMRAQGVELIGKPQPVTMVATFALPRPKTAPRSRWAPTVRPDLDHYVRALFDAVTGVLIEEDSQVVTVTASKVYGPSPGVTFTVASAVRGEQVAA